MATRRPNDPGEVGEDDEATSLDLAKSIASKRSSMGSAPHGSPPPSKNRGAGAMHANEGDEDEATEFLAARPSSASTERPKREGMSESSPSLRARGRAVPLVAGDTGDDTAPRQVLDPAALPRAPRPGGHRGIVADEDNEATDPPRITRIPQQPPPAAAPPTRAKAQGNTPSATDSGEEEGRGTPALDKTAPDKRVHRPLPPRADMSSLPQKPEPTSPFKREPTRTKTRTATTKQKSASTITDTHDAESETADGTLVVEVPNGAVVYLNGADRGTGPLVKVDNLDRYARHAVRIHASGFLPWSGSVCLEGRTAAKIRPTLKKRG